MSCIWLFVLVRFADSGTIRCSAESTCKSTDIVCPASEPCEVVCTTPFACAAATIDARGASSLSVSGCTPTTCPGLVVLCAETDTKCRSDGYAYAATNHVERRRMADDSSEDDTNSPTPAPTPSPSPAP